MAENLKYQKRLRSQEEWDFLENALNEFRGGKVNTRGRPSSNLVEKGIDTPKINLNQDVGEFLAKQGVKMPTKEPIISTTFVSDNVDDEWYEEDFIKRVLLDKHWEEMGLSDWVKDDEIKEFAQVNYYLYGEYKSAFSPEAERAALKKIYKKYKEQKK